MICYTAIFGNYDKLIDPDYMTPGWRYICYTDQDFKSDKWEIIKKPLEKNYAKYTAKRYKLFPFNYFETDVSLWVDGNFLIRGDLNELLCYTDSYNIAFFDHVYSSYENIDDSRNCIYKEAEACMFREKGNIERIKQQIEYYKSKGYPENNNLICGGVILRRHTIKIKECMKEWWQEINKYTMRDQLSFNYIAWKLGLTINYIDGNIRDNKYFKYNEHILRGA